MNYKSCIVVVTTYLLLSRPDSHTVNSAFFLAVYAGQTETVEVMLGADEILVAARNDAGDRPITVAARLGHLPILRLLLGTLSTRQTVYGFLTFL